MLTWSGEKTKEGKIFVSKQFVTSNMEKYFPHLPWFLYEE